eukprot:PhM_4_TR14886/c0_g1_i1/m.9020/K15255/PIF1; ATP-dependent DNA helicase PIF1
MFRVQSALWNRLPLKRMSALVSSPKMEALGLKETAIGEIHIVDRGALRHFVANLHQAFPHKSKFNAAMKGLPGNLKSHITEVMTNSFKEAHVVDTVVTSIETFTSSLHDISDIVQSSTRQTLDEVTTSAVALSADQATAVETVLAGHNTYIGGFAGTGKTVTLMEIVRRLTALKLRVAVTATTGVAACNISGHTFHHLFGLNGQIASAVRQYDVIIVDEVSMFPADLFMRFDRTCRRAMKNKQPFGGLQIILCGDFMQLGSIPPNPLYKCSLFLERFVHMKLTTPHRHKDGTSQFRDLLASVRIGEMPPDMADIVKCIPRSTEISTNDPTMTYLFRTNKEVDACNKENLARLPGTSHTYESVDRSVALEGQWTDTAVVKLPKSAMDIGAASELRNAVESLMLPHLKGHDILLDGPAVCVFPMGTQFISDTWGYRVRLAAPGTTSLDMRRKTEFERLLISTLQKKGATFVHQTCSRSPPPTVMTRLIDILDQEVLRKPLEVKIGARVMLRWNLTRNLVNGSLGIVRGYATLDTAASYEWSKAAKDGIEAYRTHCRNVHNILNPMVPVVEFDGGRSVPVPPIDMPIGGEMNTCFFSTGLITIPLQLGYAFTVHKVQGLTLQGNVLLDFGNRRVPVNNHLVYVGMSRVREASQLLIRGLERHHIKVDGDAIAHDKDLKRAQDVDVSALTLTTKAGLHFNALAKAEENNINFEASNDEEANGTSQKKKGKKVKTSNTEDVTVISPQMPVKRTSYKQKDIRTILQPKLADMKHRSLF